MQKTIERDLIRNLFSEASTDIMNSEYHNRLYYSLLIFFHRLLIKPRNEDADNIKLDSKYSRISFSFFLNEKQAVDRELRVDRNFHVPLKSFRSIILQNKKTFVKALVKFFFLSPKHFKFFQNFTHPFFSYFFYCMLRKKFSDSNYTGEVVVYNCINPYSLAVTYAARFSGLKVIYSEHAPTASIAAAHISLFDASYVRFYHTKLMLEGKGHPAHKIICRSADLNSKARYSVESLLHDRQINNISYCVNMQDSWELVEEVVSMLSTLKVHVNVRVHDADSRLKAFKKMFKGADGVVVESSSVSPFEKYVENKDIVICGISGVAGDCVVANTPVVSLWRGDAKLQDLYGLIDFYDIPQFASAEAFAGYFHSLNTGAEVQ